MKIVIIGAGASGLITAINAKNKNNEVIVLEKNDKSLKKFLLTGNGKCNYFNDDFNVNKYYSHNIRMLDILINENNKKRVLDFYDNIGVIPRIKNGYYYPASNQSYTIANALIKEAKLKGVVFKYNYNVSSVKKDKDKFVINDELYCDKLVISVGGKTYTKTGSMGDGYAFAKEFGHKVYDVYPALVGLKTNDKIVKELSGVRTNCNVSLYKGGSSLLTENGELQFTDYGLSGICIFNLSIFAKNGDKIHVNFLSDFDIDSNNFIDKFEELNNKLHDRDITELLECYLNYKIVNSILKISKIDGNRSFNELSDKDKNALCNNLTNYSFEITDNNGYENAQVSGGGVSLTEIDINTFESRLVKNLYFTGEVLDVTGMCGGYNLGFACLSGIICGENISK